MADQENAAVRRVVWSELFPWLMIARCFRIAIQLRLLVAAAAGTVLTLAGWAVLTLVFFGQGDVPAEVGLGSGCPWLAAASAIPDPYARPSAERAVIPSPDAPKGQIKEADGGTLGSSLSAPLASGWDQVSRPFLRMFAADATLGQCVFFLLCGLWGLVVWTFFGGAINRAAAYQLATQERLGIGAVLRFVAARWRSYLAAPLVPLLGIFVVSLPVMVLGLFLRASAGLVLAAIFWPLALVAGFLLALMVVGLLFGWPLLWSGVSSEGTDTYDAIGRAYSYTYQRPLHYLFYAAVAAAIGALGWLAVSWFFAAIVRMTYWAASWGSGLEAVHQVATPGAHDTVGGFGAAVVRFWTECVKLLGAGFLVSYFWTAAAGVYLLLRRDVDAAELDEMFIAEEPEQLPAPIPPIGADAAGAPVVEPKPEDQE